MAKETHSATIIGTYNSDLGRVMVYIQLENGDQAGLTTLVPNCGLKAGDSVNVVVDTKDTMPIPGTYELLDNLPSGVWGNACNICRHNPYIPRDPK